ncbi:cytochrome C5 [Lactobacillus porci]|uniref:Cytochrome C5 n=1 Tax=Lactobacillus porci TaxID=2012477 RepID=A0A6A8MG55_9LACO|nr:cytochrome C5 [Lactobacillus porci]MST87676.1 cytochrome C5 [Lactobacillus porci]
MARMSRRQYQERQERASQTRQADIKAVPRLDTDGASRSEQKIRLNFWQIFADRPYVSVIMLSLALFCVLAKWWIGLGLIIGLTIIGIFIIGRSHHPNRVLSLEFKLKASRKLSMIKALQLLGSTVMFLAAYMRQIVSVNFASAGTTDSLTLIQGVLNSHGTYGQQGSYFLSLFNSLTGGSLWGTYRYATNSSQMMNSSAGTMIILWIFLLMIAPAFCVLSQFFREPYSRHVMTIFSLISAASFMMTPYLMKKWVVQYAIENQMSQIAANNAVQVGGMVFPAIISAIFVFILAIYREFKRDEF